MSTLTQVKPEAKPRVRRGAVVALGVGLLLTVIWSIALVIDQVSLHRIADHVHSLYAPRHLNPDPNALFNILYVTGTIGIVLWLRTIWGASRQERLTRYVASIVFVLATGIALLGLLASEYGTRILPTVWGVLGLLPCIAGLVAVILLWTPAKNES